MKEKTCVNKGIICKGELMRIKKQEWICSYHYVLNMVTNFLKKKELVTNCHAVKLKEKTNEKSS